MKSPYTCFIKTAAEDSVEYDAFLPQIGVDRVHLLHIEPLLVRADARVGILLQLEFHFGYRGCVRDRHLDVGGFQSDSSTCLYD